MNRDPRQTPQFQARRRRARAFADRLDREIDDEGQARGEFFNQIYRNASGDGALIPWADLAPKPELVEWLAENPGHARTAIDIACGLGDNAHALSQAGYATTAFDLSDDAITWARQRFATSQVDFQTADLFNLPKSWIQAFDLAFECYTLQALPPDRIKDVAASIANLVKPGGTLLVYTRIRAESTTPDGPPWPLSERQYTLFETLGFEPVTSRKFAVSRPDKTIPHLFVEWQRKSDGDAGGQ